MRALVVDDEPPALSELSYLLERDGRFERVRPVASGADALRVLDDGEVDVVFSDISMPGLDGMELARVVARSERPPLVVFVTAHEEHAVDAFAVQAVDYVMKPVSPARLAQAVDRVVGALAQRTATDPAQDPERSTGTTGEPADERIAVELGGVTRFVRRSTVRYVQAQGDYVRLFTGSASHLLRVPLTTLETRWAEAGFVRIHRSTLVNLAHVGQVRQGQGRLALRLLPDGPELPVARRHARAVRERVLAAAADA
ncbi:putative regulatory protein [Serinicoccus hydrothermalis]|uniref:Putative regulatory protein n=1 Tax=Serinicoccus hydrothermalis TaxID=1758689 RepID=A0A1B1NE34_9MICO|nr:LytTR family DNA-binding domain-containing protein [Serinicoccus hydrothermalis]ANS79615.1 putative regulatory protein [Serinicoccus hydrothermalis]